MRLAVLEPGLPSGSAFEQTSKYPPETQGGVERQLVPLHLVPTALRLPGRDEFSPSPDPAEFSRSVPWRRSHDGGPVLHIHAPAFPLGPCREEAVRAGLLEGSSLFRSELGLYAPVVPFPIPFVLAVLVERMDGPLYLSTSHCSYWFSSSLSPSIRIFSNRHQRSSDRDRFGSASGTASSSAVAGGLASAASNARPSKVSRPCIWRKSSEPELLRAGCSCLHLGVRYPIATFANSERSRVVVLVLRGQFLGRSPSVAAWALLELQPLPLVERAEPTRLGGRGAGVRFAVWTPVMMDPSSGN